MARWGSNIAPTQEQKRALLWLRDRGGAGTWDAEMRERLTANGEKSPFVNVIWVAMDILGLVAIRKRQVTVTRQGDKLVIDNTLMENS